MTNASTSDTTSEGDGRIRHDDNRCTVAKNPGRMEI